MRFNDRSLALLGVPDLPERAFIKDAVGRIQPQGGDSSSSSSSSSGPLSGSAWDNQNTAPTDKPTTADYLSQITAAFSDAARAAAALQGQDPGGVFGKDWGYVTTTDGSIVTDGYGNPVTWGNYSGTYIGGSDNTPSGQGYTRFVPFGPNSGVYSGSLSSLGNMVAMCISEGPAVYRVITPGQTNFGYYNAGDIISADKLANTVGSVGVTLSPVPYSTGYFREYWSDPAYCTFGANSAIPAITGVMPSQFTDLQGNFIFYVDLQLQRLSGSNTWDDLYFMSAFNQAVSWVVNSNNYLASLNIAQNTNLGYYNASNYAELVTQGFDRYQVGQSLRTALRNLGLTVATISDGYFGTANAVAKSIIDNGLGGINRFATNLSKQGVIYSDIYNPNYTSVITAELKKITNIADLAIIQSVLESSIPNIVSALDYTSIDKASGVTNDSLFNTLSAFGQDIYRRAPNLQVTNGAGLAAIIDLVQNEVTANVESIAGNSTTTDTTTTSNTSALLNQTIIDSLKTYLPIGVNGGPVSVMNVIGSAAGYMYEALAAVNEGISRLYATDYGIRIRDILTDISRMYSGYPLTEAEKSLTRADWDVMLEAKKSEYYAVLSQVVTDTSGDIPAIVAQINENYLWCCQNLYWEAKNWSKANFNITTFNDTSQYLSFVSSVPSYAVDVQNIGTDYLLYGLCQQNEAGDVAKTVLAQAKTNFLLANAGVQITGIL